MSIASRYLLSFAFIAACVDQPRETVEESALVAAGVNCQSSPSVVGGECHYTCREGGNVVGTVSCPKSDNGTCRSGKDVRDPNNLPDDCEYEADDKLTDKARTTKASLQTAIEVAQ